MSEETYKRLCWKAFYVAVARNKIVLAKEDLESLEEGHRNLYATIASEDRDYVERLADLMNAEPGKPMSWYLEQVGVSHG